jgi:hypothetical protein
MKARTAISDPVPVRAVGPAQPPKIAESAYGGNASAGTCTLNISIIAVFKPWMGPDAPPCFGLHPTKRDSFTRLAEESAMLG